jgi:hypothetical protein
MRELQIDKSLECCLKVLAHGIDPPETVPAEYLQSIDDAEWRLINVRAAAARVR